MARTETPVPAGVVAEVRYRGPAMLAADGETLIPLKAAEVPAINAAHLYGAYLNDALRELAQMRAAAADGADFNSETVRGWKEQTMPGANLWVSITGHISAAAHAYRRFGVPMPTRAALTLMQVRQEVEAILDESGSRWMATTLRAAAARAQEQEFPLASA
jgi:hypothetical protein